MAKKNNWDTKKVVEQFLKAGLKCHVVSQSGTVASDHISISCKRSGKIYFCGFVVDGTMIENPSLCHVDMVELGDGDSDGGLNSNKQIVIDTYSQAYKILSKMGFTIVPSLKAYF